MCRLLRSLLVSLAVTDGVIPYPSRMCQHYSQPWENHLLSHQLEQCIDSQSYRPMTYCLHNHVTYIQGAKSVFQLCPQLPLPFCHQRIKTPGSIPTPWCYHHASVPPSIPKCHVDVTAHNRCLSAKEMEKTYWTGAIMQTNKIKDQLCPPKSGSACWQHDSGYRVNSPLDPCLYQVLKKCIAFLITPTPSWPGVAWFA